MQNCTNNVVPAGFSKIPGYNDYAISKTGVVVRLSTGAIMSPFKTRNGYLRVHTDGEKSTTSGIHRLLGLTYLPHNDDDNMIVDHINGNKLDNSLENLRWITQKENCEAAGELGISPKCIPVEVRDTRTGVITKYPSFIECAKFYGDTKDAIKYRVDHGKNGIVCYPNHLQYRVASLDPWPNEAEIKLSFSNAIPVTLRDLKTGEIKTFPRIYDLCDVLGLRITAVWTNLRLRKHPVFGGRYQIKMTSDESPWRQPGDLITESCGSKFCKPVQVFNPITRETIVFRSGVECCREMRIGTTTLSYRLKHGKRQVYQDGYIYGYYPLSREMSVPYESLGLKYYLNLETPKASQATA